MASEDSDEIVPRLFPIHGLSAFRDLDETICRLVPACGNEFDAASELLEVLLLRTQHRMLPEERDNRLQQILSPSNDVPEHVLPMVVVPPVGDDSTDAEEVMKRLETRMA